MDDTFNFLWEWNKNKWSFQLLKYTLGDKCLQQKKWINKNESFIEFYLALAELVLYYLKAWMFNIF